MLDNAKNTLDLSPNLSKTRSSYLINVFVMFAINLSAIIFVIITHINKSMEYYQESRKDLYDLYGGVFAPTVAQIFIPAIISVVMLTVVSVTYVIILGMIRKISTKTILLGNLANILFVLTVIGCLILSTSEYGYSHFELLCNIIANDTITNTSKIFESKGDSAIGKMISYHAHHVYGWVNIQGIWWILFARLAFVMSGFMIFRSSFMQKDHSAQEASTVLSTDIKKTNVGKNKVNIFLSKVFATNERAISVWSIVVTILIISPQIVYVIFLSISDSEVIKTFNWTYWASHITTTWTNETNVQNYNSLVASIKKPMALLIIQLPVIATGLSMVAASAFIFNAVRGWRTDVRTFIVQLSISLFGGIFTLVFGAVSKGYVSQIINQWNDKNLVDAILMAENSEAFVALTKVFALPTFHNNHVNHIWLSGIEYISEFVISFGSLGTAYTILIHKIAIINIRRKAQKKLNIDKKPVKAPAI